MLEIAEFLFCLSDVQSMYLQNNLQINIMNYHFSQKNVYQEVIHMSLSLVLVECTIMQLSFVCVGNVYSAYFIYFFASLFICN